MTKQDLFYSIAGHGYPIILIHGFTEHSGIWNVFSEELSENYTVITPDLPGHGKFQTGNFPADMKYYADYLNAILEYEHIPNCLMVGHSMGGYAMLEFASHFREKLSGILLFHSTAAADSEENKKNRERTVEIVRKNKGYFLQTFIPSLFAEQNKEKLHVQILDLMQHASDISQEAIIKSLLAMKERKDYQNLLSELDIPVGFIIGKQDSRVVLSSLTEQIALPKYSLSLFLDECGHIGYLEKQQETIAFVNYFAEIAKFRLS